MEEDFYHECFHGVGHGSMLVALAADAPAAFADYGACMPVEMLTMRPSANVLIAAEAGCDAATAGRRPNRK